MNICIEQLTEKNFKDYKMLRQVLKTSKAQEIGKVLLTCSPINGASIKTILKNGGFFDKTIFVDFINEDRNHYWITTR